MNTWAALKSRYRLSSQIQMKFEFGFPKYIIGKCRLTIKDACDIRTKKISLSSKGLVFSDTIPLSWFTSSALIPWGNIIKIDLSDATQSSGDVLRSPSASENSQLSDYAYGKLELNDPQEMTIDLPWSTEFTDYIQQNERLARKFHQLKLEESP